MNLLHKAKTVFRVIVGAAPRRLPAPSAQDGQAAEQSEGSGQGQEVTLADELSAIGRFLQVFLMQADLVPVLQAELAETCEQDPGAEPWPALWDLLQDYGLVWPMPSDTPPDDAAYGLRVLWESYGLPPALFPDWPGGDAGEITEVLRVVDAAARARQIMLCRLYEDSDYAIIAFAKTATFEQARDAAEAAGGQLEPVQA